MTITSLPPRPARPLGTHHGWHYCDALPTQPASCGRAVPSAPCRPGNGALPVYCPSLVTCLLPRPQLARPPGPCPLLYLPPAQLVPRLDPPKLTPPVPLPPSLSLSGPSLCTTLNTGRAPRFCPGSDQSLLTRSSKLSGKCSKCTHSSSVVRMAKQPLASIWSSVFSSGTDTLWAEDVLSDPGATTWEGGRTRTRGAGKATL